MFTSNGNKNRSLSVHVDKVPPALAHTADEAAHRVSDAVEKAGSRALKTANVAVDRASNLGTQLSDRVGSAHIEVPALPTRGRRQRRGVRAFSDSKRGLIGRLRHADEAMLKAQLAKTSRELANESAELGRAVDSLNGVIVANRRAGAARRTRLFLGIALGAAVMYHLDPEHGRERRAATAEALKGWVQG